MLCYTIASSIVLNYCAWLLFLTKWIKPITKEIIVLYKYFRNRFCYADIKITVHRRRAISLCYRLCLISEYFVFKELIDFPNYILLTATVKTRCNEMCFVQCQMLMVNFYLAWRPFELLCRYFMQRIDIFHSWN